MTAAARPGTCPCCGGAVRGPTALDIVLRDLSPTHGAIVRLLARRPGLTADEIAHHLYAGVPGGGPEHAAAVVRVTISRFRDRLARRGWRISGRTGRGGGYFLIRTRRAPAGAAAQAAE